MILLFTHEFDNATKRISEWLDHSGERFFRLNEGDDIELKRILLEGEKYQFVIKINGREEILNSDIKYSYFRGGGVRLSDNFYDSKRLTRKVKLIEDQYASYVSNYSLGKLEFLVHELNRAETLGVNKLGRYNKLLGLKIARDCGLNIPPTLISTSRQEVLDFFDQHGSLITKSIDIGFSCKDIKSSGDFHLYTSSLEKGDIKNLPESFSLSKFQKNIEKKFEVRTFFIKGRCYSGAIFSQQNQRTQVDFRRYDEEKMNRMVPFNLPKDLEVKICQFMEKANLDTGSLDFIKDLSGNYVFLEVNPVGQFGYLSDTCNYELHKVIADTISKKPDYES